MKKRESLERAFLEFYKEGQEMAENECLSPETEEVCMASP